MDTTEKGEGGMDTFALSCAKLKEEMATHSSILTWRIPQTEELGGLQSLGLLGEAH